MTPDNIITGLAFIAIITYGIGQLVHNRHSREAKQTELAAKGAEIASLERHITTLELFTSPELLKHYKATKEMLEESIDLLEQDKQSKSQIIADLQTQSQVDQEKLQEMEMLRLKSDTLAKALTATQSSLSHTVSLLERAFAGRKKGYVKLGISTAGPGSLLEGRVVQSGPPMIPEPTTTEPSTKDPETIFPQPKKPDNGNDSDDTIPRSN